MGGRRNNKQQNQNAPEPEAPVKTGEPAPDTAASEEQTITPTTTPEVPAASDAEQNAPTSADGTEDSDDVITEPDSTSGDGDPQEEKQPERVTGIQFKINAMIASAKAVNKRQYAMDIRSFVSTAILTLASEKGKKELGVILKAYRDEDAFKLLTLNAQAPLLTGLVDNAKLETIVSFHTLMAGICDATKAEAFYKTVHKDKAVMSAGLTKARHLF